MSNPPQVPRHNNPFPVYDATQSIDLYMRRLEYWFADCKDEQQRFNITMAQIPPKFFNVLAAKDFSSVDQVRQFLLYTGIVLMKQFLTADAYHHFLKLSMAYRLLSAEIYEENLELAHEL